MIYVLTPFSEGSVYVTVVTPELHSSGHLLSVCWRRVVTLLVTLLISPLCVSRQPIIQFIICGTRLCHDWLLSAAEFRSALSCSHGTVYRYPKTFITFQTLLLFQDLYISSHITNSVISTIQYYCFTESNFNSVFKCS